jgi:hypothetical protein
VGPDASRTKRDIDCCISAKKMSVDPFLMKISGAMRAPHWNRPRGQMPYPERIPYLTTSPTSHLRRIAWRLKDNRDPAIPTSWAHQPPFQPPQREVRPSCRHQRLEIKLLAVDAAPHGSGALAIAGGAAHVHLPAEAPSHA